MFNMFNNVYHRKFVIDFGQLVPYDTSRKNDMNWPDEVAMCVRKL